MFKTIRRLTILTIGVGAGFGAGYLKATTDLDREGVQELVTIGKQFFAEASEAISDTLEEKRKQTKIFEQTADIIASTQATTQQGEPS